MQILLPIYITSYLLKRKAFAVLGGGEEGLIALEAFFRENNFFYLLFIAELQMGETHTRLGECKQGSFCMFGAAHAAVRASLYEFFSAFIIRRFCYSTCIVFYFLSAALFKVHDRLL